MTANLCWRTPVKNAKSLPDQLRRALTKKLNLDNGGWVIADESLEDYLEGLRDAGCEGAEELLELIEKFGEVELKLIY